MKSILWFILKPYPVEESFSVKRKMIFVLNAFLFLLLARFVLSLVMYAESVYSIKGVREILQSHESFKEALDSVSLIVTIVLFGPIIEEIAFRGLFTTNRRLILVSLSTLVVLLLNILYQETYIYDNNHNYIRIFISALLLTSIFLLLTRSRKNIAIFISQNMVFTIFTSIILFSILHLLNYDLPQLSIYQIAMIPFALIPYVSLAISLSYVRINCGLGWAIAFHITNNSIVLFLSHYAKP